MKWDHYRNWWPNAAFSRFITIGDHIWHVQRNPACLGQPIVLLLHGAGASSHSWTSVFDALSARYDPIAFDLPGQGFSQVNRKSRCGLPEMAEDLAAMLHSEEVINPFIVAHSAGAAIALQMAWKGLHVPTCIISVNGALGHFRGAAGTLFPALAKILAANPLTALTFSSIAARRSVVDNLIRSTGSVVNAQSMKCYHALISDRRHVDATLAMMAQWDLDPLLQNLQSIQIKTLFLVGDRDGAVPPDTSDLAAAKMPNAMVRHYPAGHLLHEEQPECVLEALNDLYPKRNRA